jgi:hypothetical protein
MHMKYINVKEVTVNLKLSLLRDVALVGWWMVADSSGRQIGPIFTGTAVQNVLLRIVGKQLRIHSAQHPRRPKASTTS